MKKDVLTQQGFTLIEVLVAVVILAIGIAAVTTMQVTAIKGNSQASHLTVASDWSADQLEQIFAWEYDNALLEDDTAPNGVAGLDETGGTADGGPIVSADGFYTIYWNIADDLVMPDTKSIRVIVQRTEAGITKTMTMNYLKAKYL
ncbi:MAG: prepilin-type N-terminal cleavage/methylation domain-containing protein [Desulfobacterales bacterium]|nr:prepilin-type N-terminal cleavage/methylation domain-containing protein [Desulfobacterales bacterium]